MNIKKGSHRIVIFSGSFVVKVPRFPQPLKMIKNVFRFCFRGDFLGAWWDAKFCVRTFWRGVEENWNEFRCWNELKAGFLVPTYLSVFGLINFQQKSEGQPITAEDTNRIRKRIEFETKGDFWKTDAHTFANSRNYHKYKSGLKLLDYGGARGFVCKWKTVLEQIFSRDT